MFRQAGEPSYILPNYSLKGLSGICSNQLWSSKPAMKRLALRRTDLRDNAFHNLAHFRIAKTRLCLPLKLRVRYLHVTTRSLTCCNAQSSLHSANSLQHQVWAASCSVSMQYKDKDAALVVGMKHQCGNINKRCQLLSTVFTAVRDIQAGLPKRCKQDCLGEIQARLSGGDTHLD